MSERSRPRGCLIFGLVWLVLFLLTVLSFGLGDCARDPATGECTNDKPFESPVVWGELLLLVVGGWIFYRREMKDGDF